MTMEQLKANYTVAYRIIVRERAERDAAFAADPGRMADMDVLLEIVDDLKDELKLYICRDSDS